MSSIATQIAELWFRNDLSTRRPNISGFVDHIMPLAGQCKWIAGRSTGDTAVLFSAGDGSESEVEFARAKGKLRMVCARLRTFISERSDNFEFSPHHGQHIIHTDVLNGARMSLQITYMNTPAEQQFKIESVDAQQS